MLFWFLVCMKAQGDVLLKSLRVGRPGTVICHEHFKVNLDAKREWVFWTLNRLLTIYVIHL